ncbi:MAG: hypothetical protein HAW62_04440 [Endozoicomonadaceae bacterium]|nr:hypothetical protein [Endozoicomonadaceae bacterium]
MIANAYLIPIFASLLLLKSKCRLDRFRIDDFIDQHTSLDLTIPYQTEKLPTTIWISPFELCYYVGMGMLLEPSQNEDTP